MTDGASADAAQEFVLRAPGPEHSITKYFMGMFPGGDPGLAKKKHAGWLLEKEAETDTTRSMLEASRARPWRLLDSNGSLSHRGLPEGGLAGASSSAGYFVLIKEGDNFTAIPIDDFYSFRPTQKFKVNSLEEAERQMDSRDRINFPLANSRLAALVAQADEKGGTVADDASSGSERDEEDEDDFMSRGAQGGASGAPGRNGQPKGEADEGTDVAVDKQVKGEDWEHEDERADDDVDMGEEGEDADANPTPPKGLRSTDSDEDGRATPGLSIQSKLKDTGLESDSDDDDDDDDNDLDDDDDLDAPAGAPNKVGTADQQGARRRTPTPSPMPGPSSSQQAQAAADSRPSKRKAEDAATDGAKKAKHSEAAAAPAAGNGSGGVTEQEIVEFLKASGPIASSALTARFKRQIKTPEHKTGFTKLVKKVAKLEEVPLGSGNRCIVLKK